MATRMVLAAAFVLALASPARGQSWEAGAQASVQAPSSVPAAYDASVDGDPSALTVFRDDLAPYGSWEDDPTYGTVWVPHATVVGTDFAPYVTSGHWALDESGGWLWVSDYSWGWAPFHYGRWVWISTRGWAWIPGRVYAPARVVWRTGYYDDYYVGWAPMPPSFYFWGGVAIGLTVIPPAPYVFCASSHVFYPHVHTYIVPPARVGLIAPRTRLYVPARTYATGHVIPRGPSIAAAHVPARALPVARVAPPPRAAQLARTLPARRTAAVAVPRAPSPAVRPFTAPLPAKSPALSPRKKARVRFR